jgi:two-component system cell cycle response regulator DivK
MHRILVVEDNEINAKLVRDFLRFKGYDVLLLSNGLEVIDKLKNERVDLILMDIQLFGVSGIEAARLVKEDPDFSGIPIVAVSAFSRDKLDQYLVSELFVDFIEKPIDFAAFDGKIQKHIKQTDDRTCISS